MEIKDKATPNLAHSHSCTGPAFASQNDQQFRLLNCSRQHTTSQQSTPTCARFTIRPDLDQSINRQGEGGDWVKKKRQIA